MNYYKQKYAIGIYNKKSDELVAIFFSIQEFADYLQQSLDNAYNVAKYHFNLNKDESDIIIDHRTMTLSFIDMTDEMEEVA